MYEYEVEMLWVGVLTVVVWLSVLRTYNTQTFTYLRNTSAYAGVLQNKVWLFMELMDSCIDSILKKTGPIPEPIVGTILVSVRTYVTVSECLAQVLPGVLGTEMIIRVFACHFVCVCVRACVRACVRVCEAE